MLATWWKGKKIWEKNNRYCYCYSWNNWYQEALYPTKAKTQQMRDLVGDEEALVLHTKHAVDIFSHTTNKPRQPTNQLAYLANSFFSLDLPILILRYDIDRTRQWCIKTHLVDRKEKRFMPANRRLSGPCRPYLRNKNCLNRVHISTRTFVQKWCLLNAEWTRMNDESDFKWRTKIGEK